MSEQQKSVDELIAEFKAIHPKSLDLMQAKAAEVMQAIADMQRQIMEVVTSE